MTTNSIEVAFIGLGSMGLPMARNLLNAGFKLAIYNRTTSVTDELASLGARVAVSPAQAVTPGGIVVTMLSNDTVLESLTLGESGFANNLGAGLHISMSTVSPDTSRKLACEQEGFGGQFVAAPVFGRPEAAALGKLFICSSGKIAAKARAKPVLDVLGQGIYDFGEEAGAANVVKLAGNFMILSATEVMAEAFALAEKNGVDRHAMFQFFTETNFNCPIYKNYGRILADRAFEPAGFKLELAAKDVRLMRETAEKSKMTLPVADLVYARMVESMNKGRGAKDCTAIEMSVSEAAGIVVEQGKSPSNN